MALRTTVLDVLRVARDRDIPFLAAAIAHYTLASLVPLLLLAVSLAAVFGSEAVIESFVRNQLGAILTEDGQGIVAEALTSTEGVATAGAVSILLALWSGSKIFRGLSVAFDRIYDVETSPSLLDQLVDAAVVVGLLAVTIGAMVAIGVVVTLVDLPLPYPAVVGTVSLFVWLLALLLPIYYVLTPVDVSVRTVLPGTVLAAVGLVGLQVGFVYYARVAGQYATLGMLGALLLFVIWLYFGGIVVMLGGALNYVLRQPAETV